MSIIVRRPVLEDFLRRRGRRLLYGRRKTGKTFYTRMTLRDYRYYIVRRDGSFYDPIDDYSAGFASVVRECRLGEKIIIDEFHRAPEDFLYTIQAGECRGDLVLLTSTIHYYTRLASGADSPLLGMFKAMRVGLVSPVDLLASPEVSGIVSSKPWSLLEVQFYQEPVWIGSSLHEVVYGAYDFTQAIIGEVLAEEDIAYTRRLHGILAAVAAGKTRLSETAGHLYANRLIPTPSTGHVVKYLDQAVRVGLLERIPVHGARRRGVYRHYSPVTYTGMYLQERYNYYDTVPTRDGVRMAEDIAHVLLEVFMERLLSELYGLRPVKILNPEVDVALARGRRVVVVAEVKWRRDIRKSDIARAEENLARVPAPVRLLIVPDATIVPGTSLNVLDARALVEYAAARKPPVPL